MKYRLLFIALLFTLKAFAQQGFPFDNEIRDFKRQDSISMPKPGGMLFIGSSSIRKWTDLQQRFPGKPIISRGVGGSELTQWVKYYLPYVVFPYKPAKIFIYAGENDIAAGRSAPMVAEDFIKLYELIRQQLPNTAIYFMSIKHSPVRAIYYGEVGRANQAIANYLKGKSLAWYIDLNTALLTPQAIPDSSLFNSDYLHLNSKGYDRWKKVLQDYVK